MDRLTRHKEESSRLANRRAFCLAEIEQTSSKRDTYSYDLSLTEQARDVVSEVLLLTQARVKGFLEDVATSALKTVYGDEYGFKLDYKIKQNQTKITPMITKGEDQFSVREEVGGGVLDVLSLALRFAVFSILRPRPLPVMVLDEPGKFVSRDRQSAFGQMLRDMSERLNVQTILVSHSDDIIDQADKAFLVEQNDGISTVHDLG